MGLYVRLALVTGAAVGLFMALVAGATDSVGDYVLTAIAYGLPFGVIFSLVVGTLHRWQARKVRERWQRNRAGAQRTR